MMKYYISIFLVCFTLLIGCLDQKTTNTEIALDENNDSYKKGKEIVSSTFMALSSELQLAMKEGGVQNAVQYCNLRALPITDSLSRKHNVIIKRVSDQYRNSANKPSSSELEVIDLFKAGINSGAEVKPQLRTEEDHLIFYAPIITQELCLKCHGDIANIPEYPNIKDLYPEDLAVGYTTSQLRGIWSVKFIDSK